MAAMYNEGKAIDAVVRHIEARDACSRLSDGRSPDDEQDPDPKWRVDYFCTVGTQLHAFVEPFPNQIKDAGGQSKTLCASEGYLRRTNSGVRMLGASRPCRCVGWIEHRQDHKASSGAD